jgi:hypothetical protein
MAGARSVTDDGTLLDEQPLDEPPPRVVGDARSAFRDAITDGVPLRPVCDSWDDRGTTRALLFRGRGCALVMECRTVPDGIRVSGAAFGKPTLVSVVVRRPGRPFLRLAATAEGRFGPVTVPRGLASFVTEYSDDGVPAHWHSDWLKL